MSTQETSPSGRTFMLSRREFLRLIQSLGVLLVSGGLLRMIAPLRKQHEALQESRRTVQEFLARNPELPTNLALGCTFSVEYFTQLMPDADPEVVARLLKEKLGITQLRFPIRWSSSVTDSGALDLEKQLAYLEAFRAAGIGITLGLGIKSARWPETHIPECIKKKLATADDLPPDATQLTGSEPLSQEFFSFAEQVLHSLVTEHGFAFTAIQLENEHADLFGAPPFRYTFSDGYLQQLIELCNQFLPGSTFLLNTTGIFSSISETLTGSSSLLNVSRTLTKLCTRFPENNFRLGLDVYEETHLTPRIITTEMRPDTLSVMGMLYGSQHLQLLLTQLAEHGIATEITELQFERWGDQERNYPPGSPEHLQMMLLRIYQLVAAPRNNSSETNTPQKLLVRLWGVEQLLAVLLGGSRLTHEVAVSELISAFNQD